MRLARRPRAVREDRARRAGRACSRAEAEGLRLARRGRARARARRRRGRRRAPPRSSRSSGSSRAPRAADHDERLGRGLAALHRAGARGSASTRQLHRQPGRRPTRPRRRGPSSTASAASRRWCARASTPGRRAGAMRPALERLIAPASPTCRPARAAGAPARRPVGRQRLTDERGAPVLIDPGRLRRPPRDRPGDDAPLRRLPSRGVRRLRGGPPAAPRPRGPRRALPALPAAGAHASSSAAATPARPSGSCAATPAEARRRPRERARAAP